MSTSFLSSKSIRREDVQDYLIEKVNAILDAANIYYVKWDINRSLADIWSNELPPERQGEVYHRYILGLVASSSYPKVPHMATTALVLIGTNLPLSEMCAPIVQTGYTKEVP